jgi:hypothetical protein
MKKPSFCTYQCRYATLKPFQFHSSIPNDISKANYFCSLYNQSVWGEEPVCSQSDWDNEQPLPSDNLTFYSYKEYTYQLTTCKNKVIGKCIEFPELECIESDHIGCLIEIMKLVEWTIEKWMLDKKMLPNPYEN